MPILPILENVIIPTFKCRGCEVVTVRRGMNHVWCDVCVINQQSKYRKTYLAKFSDDELRTAARAQYAAACEHRRARRTELRLLDPEAYNAYQRDWRAKVVRGSPLQSRAWRHRTTVDIIETLWLDQGGRCPICHKVLEDDFHFDHDHLTGALRGLLSPLCNKGLGHFSDSPELLRAAADYLERGENG